MKSVDTHSIKEVPGSSCCPSLVLRPLEEAAAAEAAALFKALADPVRVRIVSLLISAPEGELCACDLPSQLGRAQPTVSHHMGLLVRAGLVAREQRGKWAWYRLRRECLSALCKAMGGGPCKF